MSPLRSQGHEKTPRSTYFGVFQDIAMAENIILNLGVVFVQDLQIVRDLVPLAGSGCDAANIHNFTRHVLFHNSIAA